MSNNNNNNKLSVFLSLVLRHKPDAANVTIDEQGWIDVNDLIKGVGETGRNISLEKLEKIVNTDSKGRYSFNEDKTKIRANQGHSLSVDVGLKEQEPPELLYHGTATRFLEDIFKQGLNGMSRLYVHLSSEKTTAKIVGARHGNPVILVVEARKMYKKGYKFYISKNGVWLCESIPSNFIKFENS